MDEVVKTIRLSATLRHIAGVKEVQVRVKPEATARDLLHNLAETSPALAVFILTPEGELAAGVRLLVGGRHIEFLQGLDTPIGQPENLWLIPPLAGG